MPRTKLRSARSIAGFPVYLEPGEPAEVRRRKIADAEQTYLAAQAMADAQADRVLAGGISLGRAIRLIRGAA